MSSKIKIIKPNDVKIDHQKNLITVLPDQKMVFEHIDDPYFGKKEVNWIAATFHGKNNTKIRKNLKGKRLEVRFQKELSGGGLAWVEAVPKGEKPKYKHPYGFYVNAYGQKTIDRVKWTDDKGNEITNQHMFFTESLNLHIYTSGLYGQYIQVKLKDIQYLDYDLDLDENIDDDTNALERYFTREVKYYSKNKKRVQKVVIPVYLENRWRYAGDILKIIPIVSSKVKEVKTKICEDNYIIVESHDQKSYRELIPSTKKGNKPAIIGDVATDPAEYHHCGYKTITVNCKEEKWAKPMQISDKLDAGANAEIIVPIVAGVETNIKTLTFDIDLQAEHCAYADTDKSHQFIAIDDSALVKAYKKYEETKKKYFDIDIPSGLTAKFKKGSKTINLTNAHKILQKSKPPESNLITSSTIEVKAAYDYTHGGENLLDIGFLKTILPTLQNVVQFYPLYFNTCAKSRKVLIAVYPDTKCTLQLGFNYSKSDFNNIVNVYHKEWELNKIEAEHEIKELQYRKEAAEKHKEENKSQRNQKRRDNEILQISENQKNEQKKLSKANQNLGKLGKTKNVLSTVYNGLGYDKLITANFVMMAEFDKDGKLDLTSNFTEAVDFFKKIVQIKEKILSIFKGQDSDVNQKSPKETAVISNRLKELDKFLEAKKDSRAKKENWSFEFLPPSIALSASWCAKQPEDVTVPTVGTEIQAVLNFNPLFGFVYKYDIYALLYKIKHPVVLAVVATLDALDDVLGDSFDIDLNLTITSKLNMKLQGTMNTKGSNNTIGSVNKQGNAGGTVTGVLEGKVRVNGKANTLVFGKYDVYAELNGVSEVGFGIDFVLKANAKELYLEPTLKFDGWILKGEFKAVVVENKRDTEENVKKLPEKSKYDQLIEAKNKIKKGTSAIKNKTEGAFIDAYLDNEVTQGTNRKEEGRGKKGSAMQKEQGIHYKASQEIIVLEPMQWPKKGEPNKFKITLKEFK